MLRLVVFILVVMLGVGVTPAAAAGPWSHTSPVSTAAVDPMAITVDNWGRATAVLRSDREPYDLYAVRSNADGAWGSTVRLGVWRYHSEVSAQTDRHGRVTVVWTSPDAEGDRVAAAVFVPGVGWRQRRISPLGVVALSPVVAMNTAGRTIVAWTARSVDGTASSVQSTVDAGGGDWRGVRTHVTDNDAVYAHDVAVDEEGRLALSAWTGSTVSIRRRSLNGTWSSWAHQANSASQSQVGFAGGNLTLLFWRVTSRDYYDRPVHSPYARLRRSDGTWTPAVRIARDGTYKLTLVVDPQGRATVAYFPGDDAYGGILARHRRSDGVWSQAVRASPEHVEHDFPIDVIADSRGVLHLALRIIGKDGWHYVRKVPGYTWSAPAALDNVYTDKRDLGVAPDGHVAGLWSRESGVFAKVRQP